MCDFGCSVTNRMRNCPRCGAKYCASCNTGVGGRMRASNVCSACGRTF